MNLKKSILYEVMTENVPHRLVSRKPIQKTFENLNNFNVNIGWKLAWENASVVNSHFVEDPTYNKNNWFWTSKKGNEKSI